MTPDPQVIGIGAVVSGRAQYDAAQARVERLKAEAEADRWTALSPWAWVHWVDVVLMLMAVALLVYGSYRAGKDALQALATPTPTAPAAAIPCPGPGLNEHTYIVLANDAGQIRMQSCTTVHILGR